MRDRFARRRYVIGVAFVITGVNHFARPQLYEAIMPPYLPWHGPLVAISGAAEVVLGVLVFCP